MSAMEESENAAEEAPGQLDDATEKIIGNDDLEVEGKADQKADQKEKGKKGAIVDFVATLFDYLR